MTEAKFNSFQDASDAVRDLLEEKTLYGASTVSIAATQLKINWWISKLIPRNEEDNFKLEININPYRVPKTNTDHCTLQSLLLDFYKDFEDFIVSWYGPYQSFEEALKAAGEIVESENLGYFLTQAIHLGELVEPDDDDFKYGILHTVDSQYIKIEHIREDAIELIGPNQNGLVNGA